MGNCLSLLEQAAPEMSRPPAFSGMEVRYEPKSNTLTTIHGYLSMLANGGSYSPTIASSPGGVVTFTDNSYPHLYMRIGDYVAVAGKTTFNNFAAGTDLGIILEVSLPVPATWSGSVDMIYGTSTFHFNDVVAPAGGVTYAGTVQIQRPALTKALIVLATNDNGVSTSYPSPNYCTASWIFMYKINDA